MPLFDTFSNRNRPRPESLVYDSLPAPLRSHCLRIIRQAIGVLLPNVSDELDKVMMTEHPTPSFRRVWESFMDSVERGLSFEMPRFYQVAIERGDFYEAMDAIETGAALINTAMREQWEKSQGRYYSPDLTPDEALDEMNSRFMQAGVGYQFSKEKGRLVRVDSEFMHKEVTEPAMALLTEKGFEGAAQEFDKAHEHYRQMAVDPEAGKDAVAWAVKAVESMAKAIMDARGWGYGKGDTIVPLLEKLFTNGLVPTDLQSYFGGLRSALTSGLPTIGNRQARHGQGAKLVPIEEHMVTLAMHLAAATIRFLVEAHKSPEQSVQAAPAADPARPA
jgi:hypothetical protein